MKLMKPYNVQFFLNTLYDYNKYVFYEKSLNIIKNYKPITYINKLDFFSEFSFTLGTSGIIVKTKISVM